MEILEEIWKDIEGYEGLYQVSNQGRIKSLGNGKSNNSKERILKPRKEKNSYLRVHLYKDGKEKCFLIHRLAASTFLENPLKLPQVNHINEDKTDNRVENLEWCTAEYNVNFGNRNERASKSLTNGKKSKKVIQYSLEGKYINEFPSIIEAKRRLGFANQHISNCCNGKYKQAYGYVWRYAE